jgi:hypothetical protein
MILAACTIAGFIAGLLFAGILIIRGISGPRPWRELLRLRMESSRAERDLHDVTRKAFVAMANRAEHRDQRGCDGHR